jgi:uncharacterized repeat protein (TIGR03803 family)
MKNVPLLSTLRILTLVFAALALIVVSAQPASAQTESVLYTFLNSSGVGGGPHTGLITDSAGNLYGAARNDTQNGVAYELIPSSGGGWTLKILYEFTTSDGVGPSTDFTMDAAGNLYAADLYGGNGYGTIFELKQISTGAWKVQVLYKFVNNGTDGHYPGATLTMDAAGNLYGTTQEGGLKNVGVVFELTPYAGGGGWSEKVLYSLPYKQKHWSDLNFPVTLDSAGNLYGVTNTGGAYDGGYVFKLSPTSKGPWTLTTLYSFGLYPPGPAAPWSGVVFDSAGNLYGVTAGGGTGGVGTVYQLSPSSGGVWTERDIVDFPSSCSPTCKPESGITIDSAGNIFGTGIGGAFSFGSAYEVSPNGDGTWTLIDLHDFGSGSDGAYPSSDALLDLSGKLYGTTIEGGGTKGRGTVFEITP